SRTRSQQRRGTLESLIVLDADEERGRWRAQGRTGGRDQGGVRILRRVQDEVRCRGRWAVWLRLGMARGKRRQASDRLDAKPAHDDFPEGEGGARPRRVGARLLSEVSEQAA